MPVWKVIAENAERGAEALVEEYGTRLYATAFRLCRNERDAEDLVFRTFEQVIDKIDEYREEQAFYGWMFTILLNYHRMPLRIAVSQLPPDNRRSRRMRSICATQTTSALRT